MVTFRVLILYTAHCSLITVSYIVSSIEMLSYYTVEHK